MRLFLNWILWIIKWPLALLMFSLLIPSFLCATFMVTQLVHSQALLLFGVPLAGVCIFWILFLRGKGTSSFAIFEHEITHMLFALLTFHKPVSLEVHHNKGGAFGYQGEGNWLISLAPYFFPTFPFLVMLSTLLYSFMNQPVPNAFLIILGVTTGYHICTTISSLHPHQTDFKKAGFLFTLLFLPTANLMCYGLLLSFAIYNWNGLELFVDLLTNEGVLFLQDLFRLFS